MQTLSRNVKRFAVALVAMGTFAGFTAGAASAAGTPPSVATGAVSAVTATTAVVGGSVDPHGHATTWYVEYGTTTSYGLKSATHSAGSGGTVSISEKLTGLKAQNTYHYAIVATSGAGTTVGTDGIVSTLGAPIASTGSVTELSATSLQFTGLVSPNGQATTYFFEFGTTTTYGTRTTSVSAGSGSMAVAVQQLVPNLNPSTLYHYRLVATSDGARVYGHDATATTAADITLRASKAIVNYGATDTLSGVVADHGTGETVGILAEPAGAATFSGIATTTTTAGGLWSYVVKPSIRTQYEVGVAGGNSPAIAIGVRPTVTLSAVAGAQFSTKITAGVPFAGHVAQVQRLVGNDWVLVRHFALKAGGKAMVPASVLPKGHSEIRIAIGTAVIGPDQAATGYLAGVSSAISYQR